MTFCLSASDSLPSPAFLIELRELPSRRASRHDLLLVGGGTAPANSKGTLTRRVRYPEASGSFASRPDAWEYFSMTVPGVGEGCGGNANYKPRPSPATLHPAFSISIPLGYEYRLDLLWRNSRTNNRLRPAANAFGWKRCASDLARHSRWMGWIYMLVRVRCWGWLGRTGRARAL